jgi:hypothetical protein
MTVKICKFLVLLFFCSSLLSAVDWPVRNKEIVTTFGSNTGGRFSIGLSIAGQNKTVHAVEDGEIIFTMDSGRSERLLPSGLGNFAVVQHQGGLMSVYTHLKDGSVRSDPYTLREGEVIGETGDSGWTYGRQLGFAVMDSEFNQFVNPLLFLPSIIDTVNPVIGGLRFRHGDAVIPLLEGDEVQAGRYDLIADIYDVSGYTGGLNPMAPFSVILYINGSETVRYSFEALREAEGTIILQKSEGRSFREIYFSKRGINLGKYDVIPGNMSIEIIAADYAGNETDIIRNIIITGRD